MERRTIVVVEDEPAQRMNAVAVFHENGYDTADFDNADEAAGYVRAYEGKILAVLTDVRMGGATDGISLVARIAFDCPKIGLLVTSGHADDILERLPPKGYFLRKPWGPDDLTKALAQVCPTADP